MTPHPYIGWARPQTFDEQRERPKVCGCGHHWTTGTWSRLHCPWMPARVPGKFGAVWSQPESEALSE